MSAFSPVDNVIQQIEVLPWFIATQAARIKSLLTRLQQVIYDLMNNKMFPVFIYHTLFKYYNFTHLNLQTIMLNGSKLKGIHKSLTFNSHPRLTVRSFGAPQSRHWPMQTGFFVSQRTEVYQICAADLQNQCLSC